MLTDDYTPSGLRCFGGRGPRAALRSALGCIVAPFAGLMLLLIAGTTPAQDDEQVAKELAEFKIADGFKIELFASDPSIAKPIQMNFDSKGRLWLATSESYPQLEPGAEPRDKVYILEDADRDGRAEKATVFADKLHIPTGIQPDGDGAYVANSTELLFFRDTDGDGKADQRDIVLSGFGTEDTHHLIHTFRMSPWGTLFFAQAVYIHSHVETPFGVRRLNGGGFWEYNPRTGKLDVFVTGMTNSWGIAFDDYGQAFGVDNDGYSVNYFLPGAHLIRTPNESLIYPSLVEGKPKYCGAEFVATPHFPDDWQGNFLTCDFRAHRLVRYRITDNGAGYKAEELPELLSTPNVAFRPVDIKFGPDGALYVCDWYNPIINHGEVDFRDPRRDKTHGRIWRITHTDRPLDERYDFADMTTQELVDLQTSQSAFARQHAARALVGRNKDEVGKCVQARYDQLSDEKAESLGLRFLWLRNLGVQFSDDGAIMPFFSAQSATDDRIRAAMLRNYSIWDEMISNPEEVLANGARNPHARVRAAVVHPLSKFQEVDIALVLSTLDKGSDPTLEYAVKLAVRESADRWIPRLKEHLSSIENSDRWVWALLAVDRPIAVEPLLALWRAGKIQDEGAVLGFIGRHGDSASLHVLLDRVMEDSSSPELRSRVLNSLSTAFRLRQAKPDGELAPVVDKLLADASPEVLEHGVRLAGLWQIQVVRGRLAELARKSETPSIRESAIESIRLLGGGESVATLSELVKNPTDDAGQVSALKALVTLDPKAAVELALPILQATSDRDFAPLFAAIVSSQEGPGALGTRLAEAKLPKNAAEAGIRQINASGQVLPGLIAALRKAGGLPMQERSFTPEQFQALAGQAMKKGDPHRGKEIYERKDLACVQCHRIRGTGGEVGPDLTSIGTSAPVDYLVESLLLPSSKVKEGFHSVVVATDEGQVFTGIPARESETELVLRTAEAKTISIPKGSIDESKTGGSLMPTDAVDALSSQEMLDLVRYLAELGKPGPFGPKEMLVARKWKLLGPLAASEREPITKQILEGSANKLDWRESLTTNDGWVYLREFALTADRPAFFATTTITVQSPGKFRLLLQPGAKAEYWLDNAPLNAKAEGDESTADVELAAGEHTLLVRVDLAKIPNTMKLRAYPIDEKGEVELAKP